MSLLWKYSHSSQRNVLAVHLWLTIEHSPSSCLNNQTLSRTVCSGSQWCCGLCTFKKTHRWSWCTHKNLRPTGITLVGRSCVVNFTCVGGWVSPVARYPGPSYNPLWAKHTLPLISYPAIPTARHTAFHWLRQPSSTGGTGSILGWKARIPPTSRPKNQNTKQKQYCI